MNASEKPNPIFPKGEKTSSDYFTGIAWNQPEYDQGKRIKYRVIGNSSPHASAKESVFCSEALYFVIIPKQEENRIKETLARAAFEKKSP